MFSVSSSELLNGLDGVVSVTFAHCGEKASADTLTFAGYLPVDAQKIYRSLKPPPPTTFLANVTAFVVKREIFDIEHRQFPASSP